MPTGPKATPSGRKRTKSFTERIRETEVLLRAWHAIRQNGETSKSKKTREEARKFGADLPRNLRKIQDRLRRTYSFARQLGATPEKAKGKGKRPLVVAPLEDRIVQRAILDILQGAQDIAAIHEVLSTPTSIGGIPGRGVGYAIDLIEATYLGGNANFVAGSDISGFFTKINQGEVCDFIKDNVDDDDFSDLFRRALHVDLANADQMNPDELKLFPIDGIGVAQGCPLSALAGNIALRDFDARLNGRGIVCLRYIDDFILLSKKREPVERAFESADSLLQTLGMKIYRPGDGSGKAFMGKMEEGHEFLGYRLVPGVYPPSEKNQERLLGSIRQEIDEGKTNILRVMSGNSNGQALQLYAQTLAVVDRQLRAWSGSFRASRCAKTADHLDKQLNEIISGFIGFYQDKTRGRPTVEKRRALGVHVLADDILARKLELSNRTGMR
jgi:RNA-directed DNA polymerase